MSSLTPRLDNYQSYQNVIANGNMDFWQRGTSFAAATSVNNVFELTALRVA